MSDLTDVECALLLIVVFTVSALVCAFVHEVRVARERESR